MIRTLTLLVGAVAAIALPSCAQVGGYIVPGEALDPDGRYYVAIAPSDERGLHGILASQMAGKGLAVTAGPNDRPTGDADYVVQYGAQWQWDVTWYLLDFNVRIYDAETNLLIASANSMRTSLRRRPSDEIVAETLGQLFEN